MDWSAPHSAAPIAPAMGQAAGTAAALSAARGVVPRELPATELVARLRGDGADLGV